MLFEIPSLYEIAQLTVHYERILMIHGKGLAVYYTP